MATGTDWREDRTEEDAKANLLSQLTSYVKKNSNQETTSEKIQRGLKDIVETMWGAGNSDGGGCCSSEDFTATQGNSTINVTRNIVGSTIRLEGNVVYNSDDWFAQEFPLIDNIIPQDFNDKKWLRATRMFVCHNKNYPAGTRGNNGYIYMNQLNSYERDNFDDVGSLPNPDTTNFFIPGIDKGSGRSFTVDGFKSETLSLDNSDPSFPYLLHDYNDPVKDHQDSTGNTSNYLFESPMDLTTQGFSIGYKTSGFVSANEDNTVYTSNTHFVDFSFVIEMELI